MLSVLLSGALTLLTAGQLHAARWEKTFGGRVVGAKGYLDATERVVGNSYLQTTEGKASVLALGFEAKIGEVAATTKIDRSTNQGTLQAKVKVFGDTVANISETFDAKEQKLVSTPVYGRTITLGKLNVFNIGIVSVSVELNAGGEVSADAVGSVILAPEGDKVSELKVVGTARCKGFAEGSLSGSINVVIAKVTVSISGHVNAADLKIIGTVRVSRAERKAYITLERESVALNGSIDLMARIRILFWKKTWRKNVMNFGDLPDRAMMASRTVRF